MLESLEQEYKREEDWCGGADKLGPNCESEHVTPMISKHLEQKEAFLKVRARKHTLRHKLVPDIHLHHIHHNINTRLSTHTHARARRPASQQAIDCACFVCQACTLARRNADVFLKYMHRNSVNMPGMLSHVKAPEQQVKSEYPLSLRVLQPACSQRAQGFHVTFTCTLGGSIVFPAPISGQKGHLWTLRRRSS